MKGAELIKVRYTLEEKQRAKSKAENTEREFSSYCHEMFSSGEITAVLRMTGSKKKAIAIPQHAGKFYRQISNLIKAKNERRLFIIKNLSLCAKETFKRFYDPHFQVDDEIYKVLNLARNDR